MGDDHCHVGSIEPSGPCSVNGDVCFCIFAEEKIDFDKNYNVTGIKHEKAFAGNKFKVECENPAEEGKNGHSFLKG
jgi:hypothetical protein